jgi:hypothetical protein
MKQIIAEEDVAQTTASTDLAAPEIAVPLDRIVQAVRADSMNNSGEYLAETETLDGGE